MTSDSLTFLFLCFQEGVEVRVARIFNTFGSRMHMNDGRVVSNFILQALQGEPLTVRIYHFCTFIRRLRTSGVRIHTLKQPQCDDRFVSVVCILNDVEVNEKAPQSSSSNMILTEKSDMSLLLICVCLVLRVEWAVEIWFNSKSFWSNWKYNY